MAELLSGSLCDKHCSHNCHRSPNIVHQLLRRRHCKVHRRPGGGTLIYWITPPRFSWRPFWTPPMPTPKNAGLLTVWSSTGTWSTYSPSSPPSSWSSSTSTPLGWSTTSERFPWRIQNPQNFQSPPFLGAVQRLRPGRRRWDDRKASSGDAWTRATGQNHNSQILIRNMHLEL